MVEVFNDKIIVMTRGDTANIAVEVRDKENNLYTPTDGDTIRFAVKQTYSDDSVLIEKNIPIDTLLLHLDPSDTKDLEQPSEYVFDVQITFNNGDVDTFIPNGRLIITQEVD